MPHSLQKPKLNAAQMSIMQLKSVAFLLGSLVCAVASAQVKVDATGQANYSHGIVVPPGVHGLAPALGIAYSSGNRANGTVGLGWALNGLSTVSRCSATKAVDGSAINVAFDENDKLCLNGERLILLDVNGNAVVGSKKGDAAGSGNGQFKEFRTERDSYSRIRSYGYADGTLKSGPKYLRVWTKDGRVIDYGDNPNSSDVRTKATIGAYYPPGQSVQYAQAWAVSRISDTFGNKIDFKYLQRDVAAGTQGTYSNGHERAVSEIQYSGNKILFFYDDRLSDSTPVDQTEAYRHNNKTLSLWRLAAISTFVNANNTGQLGVDANAVAVATTKLSYSKDTTGRSRLSTIQTCSRDRNSAVCLPSAQFSYSAGGDETYRRVSGFNLSNSALFDPWDQSLEPRPFGYGQRGVLTADFNGDGRTDILRWDAIPANNEIWLSNGDYSFTKVTKNIGLLADILFHEDECTKTIARDFNGDALIDLFKFSTNVTQKYFVHYPPHICSHNDTSALFTNNGDGTFTKHAITGGAAIDSYFSPDNTVAASPPHEDEGHWWNASKGFYFMDVDGDGILDVIDVFVPAKPYAEAYDPIGNKCLTVTCTRIFKGDGNGNFSEIPTNLAHYQLIRGGSQSGPAGIAMDSNGDGLADLSAGIWGGSDSSQAYSTLALSQGNGNFTTVTMTGDSLFYKWNTLVSIDYNGDKQSDFLQPRDCKLLIRDFDITVPSASSRFNLGATPCSEFFDEIMPGLPRTKVSAFDFNGDGRQDFYAWHKSAYLSNGDGTFTKSSTFNLEALRIADGAQSGQIVVGDFSGRGFPEFLSLGTTNFIYAKQNVELPDLLISATTEDGIGSDVTYVSLGNPSFSGNTLGSRYTSDIATPNAATGASIDAPPSGPVVARLDIDDGIGGSSRVDYAYTGLKFSTAGRGSLGFRAVRRQFAVPNGGTHTQESQFIQAFPYIGRARSQSTYRSTLTGVSASNLLSSSAELYCDQTSGAGAEDEAIGSGIACPSSAVIRRPYLLSSLVTATDLGGVAMPSISKRIGVNATGDPTSVTTVRSKSSPSSDTFTETVSNEYWDADTSCTAIDACKWILGRLKTTSTRSVAPSAILVTSAGTAPNATATAGSGSVQVGAASDVAFGSVTVGASTTLQSTLANDGAANLTLTAPSSASISGADFSFVSTTCGTSLAQGQSCTVTIKFAPTNSVVRSGKLTISTGGGSVAADLTGTGVKPTVTLVAGSAGWGTVGAGSDSGDWYTVRNDSIVPVVLSSAAATSGPSGMDAETGSGAAGYCKYGTTVLQPGTECLAFFGTGTVKTAGSYTSDLTVSYKAQGVAATTFTAKQTYTFAVATTTGNATSLAFGNVTANTTSAAKTITLTNGAVQAFDNLSVTPGGADAASFTVTHNCGSSIAANGSCTITVKFKPTAVGTNYAATLAVQGTYARHQTSSDTGLQTAGKTSLYQNPQSLATVNLTGTGTGSVASLTSSASQTFAAAWYGNAVATVTVSYRNDGNAAMSLVTPTLVAPLSVTNNTCTSVAAGAACSMVVSRASDVAGIGLSQNFAPAGATVAPSASTITWTIYTAVPSWSVASLAFGNVRINTTSTKSITLTNKGNRAYNWATNNTVLNAPAGYTFDTSACTSVAAGGGSCVVEVNFKPTTIATVYSGSALTMASASYSDNTFAVSGTGIGSKAIRTSAATLTVPDAWYSDAAATVNATYRNDGNAVMTLAAPTLVAPLSVTANTCAGIAAGASCSMTVTRATTTAGLSQSQAFAPAGADVAPASTTVTWTVHTAVPHWGSSSLSFGNVTMNQSSSKSIVLTNDGNTVYNWATNKTITNKPTGFTFDTSACAAVAPGGSCNVVVTFSPTSNMSYSGSGITLASASYSFNTFSVSGSGVTPPSISASTSSLTGTSDLPTAVSKSLSFSNSGQTSTTLTITAPSGVTVSPNSLSCPANGACGSVTVSASSAGTYSGNLGVTSSKGGTVPSVSINYTVVQPALFTPVSGTNLNYTYCILNGTGSAATATLKNVGSIAFTITAIDPGAYKYEGSCTAGQSLAPNASCTAAVRYPGMGVNGTMKITVPSGSATYNISAVHSPPGC